MLILLATYGFAGIIQRDLVNIITNVYSNSDPYYSFLGLLVGFSTQNYKILHPSSGAIIEESNNVYSSTWDTFRVLKYVGSLTYTIWHDSSNKNYRVVSFLNGIQQMEATISLSTVRAISPGFKIKIDLTTDSSLDHFIVDGGSLIEIKVAQNTGSISLSYLEVNSQNTNDAIFFVSSGIGYRATCEVDSAIYKVKIYNRIDNSLYKIAPGTDGCVRILNYSGSTSYVYYSDGMYALGSLKNDYFTKKNSYVPIPDSDLVTSVTFKNAYFSVKKGTGEIIASGKGIDTLDGDPYTNNNLNTAVSWSTYVDSTVGFEAQDYKTAGIIFYKDNLLFFFETSTFCWKRDYSLTSTYCTNCYDYYNPIKCTECGAGYSTLTLLTGSDPTSECYKNEDVCPEGKYRSYIDMQCKVCPDGWGADGTMLVEKCSYALEGNYVFLCASGAASKNSTGHCQRICNTLVSPVEYIDKNQNCASCNIEGCLGCVNWPMSGSPECIACDTGYNFEAVGNSCTRKCPAGQTFAVSGSCTDCSDPNAAYCDQNDISISLECKDSFQLNPDKICLSSSNESPTKNSTDSVLQTLQILQKSPTEFLINLMPATPFLLLSSDVSISPALVPHYLSSVESSSSPSSLPSFYLVSLGAVSSASVAVEGAVLTLRACPTSSLCSSLSFSLPAQFSPLGLQIDTVQQGLEVLSEFAAVLEVGALVLGSPNNAAGPGTLKWNSAAIKVYGLIAARRYTENDANGERNFEEWFEGIGKIGDGGWVSRLVWELLYKGEDKEIYYYYLKNRKYSFFSLYHIAMISSFVTRLVAFLLFFGLYKGIRNKYAKKILFGLCFSFCIPNTEYNLLIAGGSMSRQNGIIDQIFIFIDSVLFTWLNFIIYKSVRKNKGFRFSDIPCDDSIILKALSSKKSDYVVFHTIIYFSRIIVGVAKSMSWIIFKDYPIVLLSCFLIIHIFGIIMNYLNRSIIKSTIFVIRVLSAIAEICLTLSFVILHFNSEQKSIKNKDLGVIMIFVVLAYCLLSILEVLIGLFPSSSPQPLQGGKITDDSKTKEAIMSRHTESLNHSPLRQLHQKRERKRSQLKNNLKIGNPLSNTISRRSFGGLLSGRLSRIGIQNRRRKARREVEFENEQAQRAQA